MANRRQRDEMRDYIVENLRGSHQRVEPVRIRGQKGLEPTTILVDDDSTVLLVDQAFTGGQFREWYGAARQTKKHVAPVFFKDGEVFFRSAAQDNWYKEQKGLSLKNYSHDQIGRLISLRPEEKLVADRNGMVQYYQPESANLREGIVSFGLTPVVFDYSHISSGERYGPVQKTSQKLYVSDRTDEVLGVPLVLKDSKLVARV